MSKIKFTKMAGAGNDFLVIDAQKKIDYKKLTEKACNRTDGIGADGVLILDKSKKADYKMRIINADGSEAEMCGNGARCMAAYIVRHEKPRKKIFTMETLAGIIKAEAKGEVATVRLSDPKDYQKDIIISMDNRPLKVNFIDTGVPHTIVFVENINGIDVKKIGEKIRYHKHFQPRGTNANFVEIKENDLVECRTYERGVENETRACGTGSVAAGIVSYLSLHPHVHNHPKAKMRVKTTSGEILNVTFDILDNKITNVYLNGSAKFIAQGEYFF